MRMSIGWILISALLLTGCTLVMTQGSGNVVTETREVSDFQNVEICCGMQLNLTQGDEERLTIEAEDNIISEIETVVSRGTLSIRFHQNVRFFGWRLNHPIRVNLQMREIQGISISSGSSLDADNITSGQLSLRFSSGSNGEIGNITAEQITLQAGGGAHASIRTMTTDTLDVQLSSGSEVRIDGGSTAHQQIDVSSGSTYLAGNLQSEVTVVDAGSGSSAEVNVSESLVVNAGSGSQVEYSGNPQIQQNLSSGSQLRARN